MTAIIDYKNSPKKNKLTNLVLFCNEKLDISGLNRYVSLKEYSYISDLIKTKDLKKKIHSFELSSKRKIILVAFKRSITSSEAENLGANFYKHLKESKINECYVNSETVSARESLYDRSAVSLSKDSNDLCFIRHPNLDSPQYLMSNSL